MNAKIVKANNYYCISFPYNQAIVADLKANIPSYHLRWDSTYKVWKVTLHKISEAIDLLKKNGASINFDNNALGNTIYHNRLITLDYLGACKAYKNDVPVSHGYSGGNWSIIVPQKALIDFFGDELDIDILNTRNLFNILKISQISSDAEVKSAYKTAAKKYHPDVYRNPNSNEIFKKINDAYSILKTQDRRDRYAIGLKMEGMLAKEKSPDILYRPPLNCGRLRVVYTSLFEDTILVETILSWDKLTNKHGQVAIARWNSEKNQVEKEWLYPSVKS